MTRDVKVFDKITDNASLARFLMETGEDSICEYLNVLEVETKDLLIKKNTEIQNLLDAKNDEISALSSLVADLKAAIEEIRKEARGHRIQYNMRCQGLEQPDYWKGRRDEAGHFRDRIDTALLAVLGSDEQK